MDHWNVTLAEDPTGPAKDEAAMRTGFAVFRVPLGNGTLLFKLRLGREVTVTDGDGDGASPAKP
jgi:hypothetical protein